MIPMFVTHFYNQCMIIFSQPIMIYSSLLTCLFCTLLGSHLQLHWAPSWLAAALIFLYCMTVTSGANIVPFVIVAEIFLPEVFIISRFIEMVLYEYRYIDL